MKKKKNSNVKHESKKIDHQIDLETTKKKKLTTRQRKALTKIIEKKQKNQKRTDMLNELKSLELTAPTLSFMTSISQTQTRGLRNVLKDKKKSQTTNLVAENNGLDEMTVNNEDIGSKLMEDEIA